MVRPETGAPFWSVAVTVMSPSSFSSKSNATPSLESAVSSVRVCASLLIVTERRKSLLDW